MAEKLPMKIPLKAQVKEFVTLTKFQYVAMLGMGISGMASLLNIYDAISKISEKSDKSVTQEMKDLLRVKFIVILVISIVAIIVGILIGYFLRTGRTFGFGLSVGGLFGILYAGSMQLSDLSNTAKITGSLSMFVTFILVGVLADRLAISGTNKKD